MKYNKLLFLFITSFLITSQTKAQSKLVFENVMQRTMLLKPGQDSNYTYNFEYLSHKQLEDFGYSWNRLLHGGDLTNDFLPFYESDEISLYSYIELRSKLILMPDSIEQEIFDETGNFYQVKVSGPVDSSWFFYGMQGVNFKEDWIFDTLNFSCEIKSKLAAPLVIRPGKEELGPVELFHVKPAPEQKNFEPVTDFIITDVYVKQDPMTDDHIYLNGANTYLDYYKLVLFMNSTIDKLKKGKLKGYAPTIPFTKGIDKKEMKTMFTDEFVANKHEKFPVRYKMYNYRFKMVEKWWFDPTALAMKKEALGIVIMRRNEADDLNKKNETDGISYTFTPVAYVPFNQK